ncbi:hypothetical protein H4R33_002938 [Dimargaris cristalligena]|nr:hypothetical protein H4R33_002938 [Dimargaris cristalligena]
MAGRRVQFPHIPAGRQLSIGHPLSNSSQSTAGQFTHPCLYDLSSSSEARQGVIMDYLRKDTRCESYLFLFNSRASTSDQPTQHALSDTLSRFLSDLDVVSSALDPRAIKLIRSAHCATPGIYTGPISTPILRLVRQLLATDHAQSAFTRLPVQSLVSQWDTFKVLVDHPTPIVDALLTDPNVQPWLRALLATLTRSRVPEAQRHEWFGWVYAALAHSDVLALALTRWLVPYQLQSTDPTTFPNMMARWWEVWSHWKTSELGRFNDVPLLADPYLSNATPSAVPSIRNFVLMIDTLLDQGLATQAQTLWQRHYARGADDVRESHRTYLSWILETASLSGPTDHSPTIASAPSEAMTALQVYLQLQSSVVADQSLALGPLLASVYQHTRFPALALLNEFSHIATLFSFQPSPEQLADLLLNQVASSQAYQIPWVCEDIRQRFGGGLERGYWGRILDLMEAPLRTEERFETLRNQLSMLQPSGAGEIPVSKPHSALPVSGETLPNLSQSVRSRKWVRLLLALGVIRDPVATLALIQQMQTHPIQVDWKQFKFPLDLAHQILHLHLKNSQRVDWLPADHIPALSHLILKLADRYQQPCCLDSTATLSPASLKYNGIFASHAALIRDKLLHTDPRLSTRPFLPVGELVPSAYPEFDDLVLTPQAHYERLVDHIVAFAYSGAWTSLWLTYPRLQAWLDRFCPNPSARPETQPPLSQPTSPSSAVDPSPVTADQPDQPMPRFPNKYWTVYQVLLVAALHYPNELTAERIMSVLADLFRIASLQGEQTVAIYKTLQLLGPTILSGLDQRLSRRDRPTTVVGLKSSIPSPLSLPGDLQPPSYPHLATTLVRDLLAHANLAPLVHHTVFRVWANIYDNPGRLLSVMLAHQLGPNLNLLNLGAVFYDDRSHPPVHPLAPTDLTALMGFLDYASRHPVPWEVYLPAYLAVGYSFYCSIPRQFKLPQIAISPANMRALRKLSAPYLRVLQPPLARIPSGPIPRNVYNCIKDFFLWPLNQNPDALTTLVIFTHQVLIAQIPPSTDVAEPGCRGELGPRATDLEQVMKALAIEQRMSECRILYERLIQARLTPTEHHLTILLRGYTAVEDRAGINWTFQELRARDIPVSRYIYTIMIDFALQSNDPEAAFNYYEDMREAEIVPQGLTFRQLLKAVAQFAEGQVVYDKMQQIIQDISSIQMFQREVKEDEAEPRRQAAPAPYYSMYTSSPYDQAQVRLSEVLTTPIFNRILRAFIHLERYDLAENLVRRWVRFASQTDDFPAETQPASIADTSITPNDQTYTLLAKLYQESGNAQRLRDLLQQIRAAGYTRYPPALFSVFFRHFIMQGDLGRAWTSWQAFNQAYVTHSSQASKPNVPTDSSSLDRDSESSALYLTDDFNEPNSIVEAFQVNSFLMYYAHQNRYVSLRRLLDLAVWYEGWSPLSQVAEVDLRGLNPKGIPSGASPPGCLLVFPGHDETWLATHRVMDTPWTWSAFTACMGQGNVDLPSLPPSNCTDPYLTEGVASPAASGDIGGPAAPRSGVRRSSSELERRRQEYATFVSRWERDNSPNDETPPISNLAHVAALNRFEPRALGTVPPLATHLPRPSRYMSIFMYTWAIDHYLTRHRDIAPVYSAPAAISSTGPDPLNPQAYQMGAVSPVSRTIDQLIRQTSAAAPPDQSTEITDDEVSAEVIQPTSEQFSTQFQTGSPLPPLTSDLLNPARPFVLLRPDLDPDPFRSVALALLCHLLQNIYIPEVAPRDSPLHLSRTFILSIDQRPFVSLIRAYGAYGDSERVRRIQILMEQAIARN